MRQKRNRRGNSGSPEPGNRVSEARAVTAPQRILEGDGVRQERNGPEEDETDDRDVVIKRLVFRTWDSGTGKTIDSPFGRREIQTFRSSRSLPEDNGYNRPIISSSHQRNRSQLMTIQEPTEGEPSCRTSPIMTRFIRFEARSAALNCSMRSYCPSFKFLSVRPICQILNDRSQFLHSRLGRGTRLSFPKIECGLLGIL